MHARAWPNTAPLARSNSKSPREPSRSGGFRGQEPGRAAPPKVQRSPATVGDLNDS